MSLPNGFFVVGPDTEANGERLRQLILEHAYPQDLLFSVGVAEDEMVAFENGLPSQLRLGSPIVFDPTAPYVEEVDLWTRRDWDSLTWATAVVRRMNSNILAVDVKAPHAGWVLGNAAATSQIFASITENDPEAVRDLFCNPANPKFSLMDYLNVTWVDPVG